MHAEVSKSPQNSDRAIRYVQLEAMIPDEDTATIIDIGIDDKVWMIR